MKKWYEIVNQAAGVAEILIYGYIGQYDEVSFVDFQAEFRQLESLGYNTCIIRIHSGGGSVLDGLPIYDLIHGSKMECETIVEGMAASMAGPIAMAGKKRGIAPSGMFMIHKVQAGQFGNAAQLRSMADLAEDCENRLKAIYVERTGQTQEVVDGWFASDADLWINAKEALRLGLVTYITNDSAHEDNQIPPDLQNAKEEDVFKIYNKVTNQIQMNKLKASLVLLLASYGITLAEADSDEKFFESVKNALAKKEEEINNVKKESATAMVNEFLALGKCTKEEVEPLIQDAIANPALVAKVYAKIPVNTDANANGSAGNSAQPKNISLNINSLFGLNNPNNNGKDLRAEWTFDDYASKDPSALEKMQSSEPEKFQALYSAKAALVRGTGQLGNN